MSRSTDRPGPVIHRAPGRGAAFDARVRECLTAFTGCPELTHLGHVTRGEVDFEILDEAADCHEDMAAQLADEVDLIGTEVNRLGTGGLLRVVVHGSERVGYVVSVVPRQYLVGLGTPGPATGCRARDPGVRSADRTVCLLATRLRRAVGRPSWNPGAFDPAPGPEVISTTGPHHLPVPPTPRTARADWAELAAALRPDGPHWIAWVRDWRVEHVADVFDQVPEFFTVVSSARRRRGYIDVAVVLPRVVATFLSIAPPLGSTVRRLVLDSEEGAVYLYRVDADTHVVAVTLDQRLVSACDDQLDQLLPP